MTNPRQLLVHVVLSLFLGVWALEVAAGGVVCKKRCVVGFEEFCNRAHSFTEQTTRRLDQVRIYIERNSDGTFSYASNVQSQGADYPTKIIGFPEARDLDGVLINLDQSFLDLVRQDQRKLKVFHETAEVYVTKDVFRPDGSSEIDFGGINKVHIVDPHNGTIEAERLDAEPPPVFVSKIAGCCLKGRPPSAAPEIAARLAGMRFRQRDTKILSLVIDSSTERDLRQSKQLKSRVVKSNPEKMTDVELGKILDKSRGETLIVIGHVDGKSYVIQRPDGRPSYSIEISRLRGEARKRNVQLIDLGCRTGKILDKELASVGVADRFLTTDAVRRLEQTFSRAETLSEFLQGLSDEKFSIVADKDAFIDNTTITAGIYTPARAGKEVRVGELGITKYEWDWMKSWAAWIQQTIGFGE